MCKYCEGDTFNAFVEADEEMKVKMLKNWLDLNYRSFGKENITILCPECGKEL